MKKLKFLVIAFICFGFIFTSFGFASDDTNNQRGGADKAYMTLGEHPTSGDIYYVNENSSNSQDSLYSHGGSWDKPFNTIDFAIGACTANDGDIIYVAAGHTENLSSADAIDADVAGITIIGLGNGVDRPTLTYTGTAGEFVIGAANVTVENFRFVAGVSNIIMGISVETTGDNFTLKNCEVPESGTATFDFADFIDLASGADGITIDGMKFSQLSTTPGDLDHFLEAGTGVNKGITIINSDIRGEFLVSAIWSNKADTLVLIDNNVIVNATNGQHAIEFTSTATGLIRNTSVSTDAQATAIDPGSFDLVDVTWNSDTTADVSGVPAIAPAVSASGVGTLGGINDTTTDSINGKIGTDTEMADSSLYDMLIAAAFGTVNATTTDGLHGKIGTDTEMADSSLYDMLGPNTAATTDSINGKLGTDAEFADNSIYDLLGSGAKTLALSTAIGSSVNGTTTDTLHGKIGTDTEMADNSLYDLNVADQIDLDAILADTITISGATLPAAPTANSLAAFIASGGTALGTELADSKSIVDALGTDGTTPIDAATSILGAIGVNDANNAMDTSTVVVNNDGSVFERLEGILDVQEKAASTSTAVMANGNTIFTIAGGPIKIVDLVSVCITGNDATASTLQYSADPTAGAATTFSGASASLANLIAGDAVVLNQTALATAPDISSPLVALGSVSTNKIIVNEGIITIVIGVGSTTGTWKHYLRYIPLGPGVTVTGT